MKLVVHLADFGWPVEADELAGLLGDVAELTEGGAFDGIAVGDHLWQHPIMGGPRARASRLTRRSVSSPPTRRSAS